MKYYEECIDEKNFIATIINHAILESTLYRSPRDLKLRGLRKNKKIKLIFLIKYCMDIIEENKNTKSVDFCLKFFNYFNFLLFRKEETEAEKLAYEARDFLNEKSWLLNFYLTLIGIDTEYFCEKFKKLIKKFDDTGERIFTTRIDFSKVNTLQ